MKKSVLSFILIVLLVVLSACGNTDNTGKSSQTRNEASGKNGDGSSETPGTTGGSKADNGTADDGAGSTVKLSFKSTASVDYLKSLNGKQVTINGYLATSSPADGSFIFLMNLPYQSCPFCVPNTSQLVNTLEVYPKDGETFGYTTQAVSVTGTLDFSDGEMYTDAYGYEFAYRLVDAEYFLMTEAELTDQMKMYNSIADSGIIDDFYHLYDYVYFVCDWPEYYCDNYYDADGNLVNGFYFFDSDFYPYIEQYYSDISDDFYNNLVTRIGSLDKDGSFAVMADNIKKVKELASEARAEFDSGAYTCEIKNLPEFGTEDYVFSLNRGAELLQKCDDLYMEFCEWINSYEM